MIHREALKRTRKILTLIRRSFSLSHKICINFKELSLICENDQSLMFDDFEKLLNSAVNSRSQQANEIGIVIAWESQIIKSRKMSQRKVTLEEQKEIKHLISLGVPKTTICKKYDITYATLEKYLAINVIE